MKLSNKQRHFAMLVGTKGHTYSEAYRQSYNCDKMANTSINVEACKLMKNPNVAQMVERLQKDRERETQVSALSDRERILNRLRVLLESAEGTPSEAISLKAANLLGQSIGLYSKNVTVDDKRERSPDQIKREIMEKLALIQDAPQ